MERRLWKDTYGCEQDNIDLMSISSHKIYGPKGMGACTSEGDREEDDPSSVEVPKRGLRSGTLALFGL